MLAGFDIGGTNARGLLIEPTTGDVIGTCRGPSTGDGPELVATISGMVSRLQDDNDAVISAVGLGVAGLAHRSGTIRYSPNLPGLVEFPIGPALEDVLGVPVVLGNDATTGAWAEACLGAGRGAANFVFVALGTGIGTGFVADGRLITGAYGFAGEAGHMVVDRNGAPHRTGQRGPWEYFASGTALGRMAREAAADGRFDSGSDLAGDIGSITGHHLVTALATGDDDARRIFDSFCSEVALGVANLVLMLDPESVVIGGGLADIGAPLVDGVGDWLDRLLLGAEHRPHVDVVLAELGSDAGALGAALLAADLLAG